MGPKDLDAVRKKFSEIVQIFRFIKFLIKLLSFFSLENEMAYLFCK